jgi:flagellin
MGFRILTNTMSLVAQTNLTMAQKRMNLALERLSSGARINHADDDPAGYMLSIQMQFQITGTDVGTNNLYMAIDAINTADAFVKVMQEDLQRMNELAYLSKNDLMTVDQRRTYDYEFTELIEEINRLAQNANYNGRVLMTGSLQGVTVQTGASATDVVQLSINTLTVGANGLVISALFISTIVGANAAIIQLNSSVRVVLGPAIAAMGAQASGWKKSASAQEFYSTNLKAARSRVYDADIAVETTNLTNSQVIVQSGIAALAQSNAAATMALGLIGGQ